MMECVPPCTHGVFARAVRLALPRVLREPGDVKPAPPCEPGHKDIQAMEGHHLEKIPQCFADHWDQVLRYLRPKGMGKHRRGSNSESGRRLLRRLEKNHDGIRSAATRQHYIQ